MQIGYSVQERLYSSYTSYQDIFHECLTFVRSEEDIEDEELDGGIKRQWLSQFEFAKLFNTIPEPRFLGWMALWYSLPAMENGERERERERDGERERGSEREEREGGGREKDVANNFFMFSPLQSFTPSDVESVLASP